MYRQLECYKRYALLSFGNKDYYLLFIYSVFSSWDSCECHFLVYCSLTKQSRFQASVPSMNLVSKQMHHQIARSFLIWSTPTGYEELAGRFEPIRNGEIFRMTNKRVYYVPLPPPLRVLTHSCQSKEDKL